MAPSLDEFMKVALDVALARQAGEISDKEAAIALAGCMFSFGVDLRDLLTEMETIAHEWRRRKALTAFGPGVKVAGKTERAS